MGEVFADGLSDRSSILLSSIIVIIKGVFRIMRKTPFKFHKIIFRYYLIILQILYYNLNLQVFFPSLSQDQGGYILS